MHKERFKRHGYFELKRERGEHGLEKLPHEIDKFIIENCKTMIDHEIANKLLELGYSGANAWNVRYRRRKLGIKKYLYGEVLKHKAWVRAQAIKSYGNKCELCDYTMAIDTHHIIPKYQGGPHKIDNLMVMCPNCHALVTRNYIKVSNRKDIPKIRLKIKGKLKTFYPS
ncbi:MAG: hypothetical protein UX71_C0018G0013 [Parcubacteria group bacterium GW2011_GWA1_47_10]|uniref:HNH nuclease domain-containing protein n=1 Tax=Candidatus Nomurabacteria bacterium GW2011_GWB1_47_6 TaxID=1618749 RepID=A0A0G1V8S8_9BACT|nr:MAG: hypothetical protein UX71_C0018G0013 [Parcubacteria group bacterium GW2011_GWA1_47_10]KKU74628.1 MAG: hypothetical protein UY01_C0030G0003 [Candidatus Nomurabacteria bacterium GW2011_GWB1_47_6]